MKLFFLLLTLSSYVFAGPIFWELADELAMKATTPQEIKEVVNAYPVILSSGVEVSQIKLIEIIDRTYVYIGETICQNDDPRLKKNFVAWSLCQKNGTCQSPVVGFTLPSKDPCASR